MDTPLTHDPLDDSALVAALVRADLPTDLGYCLYSRAMMTRPAVHALCGQIIAALATNTDTRRRRVRHYYLHADWEGICMAVQRWNATDYPLGTRPPLSTDAIGVLAGTISGLVGNDAIDALFGPPIGPSAAAIVAGEVYAQATPPAPPAPSSEAQAHHDALLAAIAARVAAAISVGRRVNTVELGQREQRALIAWPGAIAGQAMQLIKVEASEGIGLYWQEG